MRDINRIDYILTNLDFTWLLKKHWKFKLNDNEIEEKVKIINDNLPKLRVYWKTNQNLRIAQVLINSGIIPNYPGFYYYEECSDIIKKYKEYKKNK